METALPEGLRGRLLAAALTLTALAVLWFGIAMPLLGWYRAGTEELAQRRILLLHMQRAAEELPALEHGRTAGARPMPAALLVDPTDALAAAAMQSAVQGMASAAGVSLASMETLPAEIRGDYRRIGLRVSFSAAWPAVVALLQAAGRGPPRMLIDDLQLRSTPMPGHAAAMPVNASFTLLAFRAAPAGGNK